MLRSVALLGLGVIAMLALTACSSASSSGAKTTAVLAGTPHVAPAKLVPRDTPAPTVTPEVRTPVPPEYWRIVTYSFMSPTEGWLIRTSGAPGGRSPAQILHTDDGGETWTMQYETTDFSPVAITFLGGNHLWVGGGTGEHCLDFAGYRPACTVAGLMTSDAGKTWVGPTVQAPQWIGDISVEGSPASWAVAGRGNSGGGANTEMDVFTVRQDGAAWKDVLKSGRGLLIDFGLAAFSPARALVITGAMQYATDDGGVSWQDSASPCSQGDRFSGQVLASFALPPSNVWLVCMIADQSGTSELRTLVHTADSGATWEVLAQAGAALPGTGQLSTNNIAPSLDFLDPADGWYASGGPDRHVYRTSDGGHTWQSVEAPAPSAAQVQFFDADHGWMVTGAIAQHFARTTDGGAHWSVVTLP